MYFKTTVLLFLAVLLWNQCRNTPPPTQEAAAEQAPAPLNVTAQPDTTSSAPPDQETAVCQVVLKKIFLASGDAKHAMPTVFVSGNTTCMAAFFPRKNAIEVERQTYEVCRSFGADSLNALALVLSHELSHALDNSTFRSNFWAYNRQPGGSVAREKAADVRGAFMAHLAGYSIVPIVPKVIRKLYAAYPAQNQSAAYPPETERRHTAIEVQGLVDTLIQVFDAANYLLAAGQSDMAACCYDHLLQWYQSPEIWNNLGVADALEALRIPGGDDYAYPFELDWQLRLSRPRDRAATAEQERQRAALLQRAGAAFAEALRLAPGHFSASANAWCLRIMTGDAQSVARAVDQRTRQQSSTRVESERLTLLAALAAAHTGEKPKAEKMFAQLAESATTETAALARYNLEVLQKGSAAAVLHGATSPCLADPAAFGLPSVLVLRRWEVNFRGLRLGQQDELELAWEKKADHLLLKARMGTGRGCILHLAMLQRPVKLPKNASFKGVIGANGSHLIVCEDQYLQVFQSDKMSRCGVFYAYGDK